MATILVYKTERLTAWRLETRDYSKPYRNLFINIVSLSFPFCSWKCILTHSSGQLSNKLNKLWKEILLALRYNLICLHVAYSYTHTP